MITATRARGLKTGDIVRLPNGRTAAVERLTDDGEHFWDTRGVCRRTSAAVPVPPGTGPDLTTRLTEWIKEQGVTGHYPADQIAARITRDIHPGLLAAWLDQDAAGYLRDMCARIKDDADLTDEEWARENYWHGHGGETNGEFGG